MKPIKILAIDLGLKTGFALFNQHGRLQECFSSHFASRKVLKKAVYQILKKYPDLTHLVIEGGGDLAPPWQREADKRGVSVVFISAEEWRQDLLFQKERRSGKSAKQHADTLARAIIAWSGSKKPASLRHDCAEAILAGFWFAMTNGLCRECPVELKKRLNAF